ncbi:MULTISPECIES: TonB-dependent receptor [Glaesserella]|uniref:TonB-dependent receptor n=1 Tax=Glaesserella australis TaxID=2094024 RepID=A0A328BYC7_9PAST|nr:MULTISPECIES: TonB-dependent receptor [Glaesserella]AUI66171.1 TonB-dependent receptor [Glaesserella sp. 15-184]RAL19193.1 TonB-dependent receptor [Glaesserella australis]
MKKNTVAISLCFCSGLVIAEESAVLDEIQVEAKMAESNLLGDRPNVSDQLIDGKDFKQKATTLGDALSSELGIHSNQYGSGASAPIIRGQEGKRIKILQNNSDVIDMSMMSPDHTVTVDTALSKQVEIVRGPSTLLYSSGNAAGVVNVVDNKIPTVMPKDGLKGDLGFRFNTNNNEKLSTAGLTFALSQNVAVHLEGLARQAGNYKTPNYLYGTYADKKAFNKREMSYQNLSYVPESWAKSKVGTAGISWIHEKGHLGLAYTERQDKYGLPAHNHIYEGCAVRIIDESMKQKYPYLFPYPELADDQHLFWANPGVNMADCHAHGLSATPYVDLQSKRYDLRGEMIEPVKHVDKLRFSTSYVDYQHGEIEGSRTANLFKNKGITSRLEIVHSPIGDLTGVWGIQYLQQKNSALSPEDSSHAHVHRGVQQLLNNNKMQNWSLFGLESYQWNDFTFELSTRLEKQKVTKSYDHEKVRDEYLSLGYIDSKRPETKNAMDGYYALTKPHKETARSFAAGIHWAFRENYKLSLTVSHQERLPNAQELYAHGMHLATNSFEMGNKGLTKEKSNNIDLGLSYQDDKFNYYLSGFVYNFENYTYLYTVNSGRGPASMKQDSDLRINRYMQAPARFYGVEANIGYQVTPKHHISIFGDYVKGYLKEHDIRVSDKVSYVENPAFQQAIDKLIAENPNLKPWRARSIVRNQMGIEPNIRVQEPVYEEHAKMYTPRLPPIRFGTRIKSDFTENLKGELEYYRVFSQHRISKFESKTQGHNMLNIGLTYQNKLGKGEYEVFMKGNNLLNEAVYAHETFLPYIPQMGRSFSFGVNYKF